MALSVSATEPSGYYSSCENKNGASLLTALNGVMGDHTKVSYDGLWTLYKDSDTDAQGKIWDMYSTKRWTYNQQKCGTYKNVGDCYNREHSFPKSWFNDASPMVSDAFHIYPTDGKVNGQRSNYPFGECANGTSLGTYNGVTALGKLGTSTFSGYSGKVFEPDDQYKGDFARSYFYMAAAYNTHISSWHSDMLAGNSYPAFSNWAIQLLLKWHRQDPVSDKERNRNEAVYARQHNRNPFIDHPELAEYIWGDRKNQNWTLNASSDPELQTPVDGSTVSLGNAAVGVARSVSVGISGAALKDAVSVSVSGAGYSVSPTTLSAAAVNSGASVTVTLTAAAAGSANGTLTVTCGKLKSTVNLRATALDGLPASSPTHISDCSFMAHWTYIGMEDGNGCYTLHVRTADGQEADTYPRSVKAKDESAVADELEPETTYTYYVTNGTLTSNVITVTTAAPLPSIQFLYDGETEFATAPGTPSEAAEMIMETENISGNVTLNVNEPFQLSADKADWSTALSLDPRQERFYVRVNSDKEGTFSSVLTATAGDYTNDEVTFTATVSAHSDFVETFENEDTGTSYADGKTIQGVAAAWTLSNIAIIGSEASKAHGGEKYARFGKNATSTLTLAAPKKGGIGSVKFFARNWSASEGDVTLHVETSADDGQTWDEAGSVAVPNGTEYKEYNVAVNRSGNLLMRVRQSAGKRFCLDDLSISDYTSGVSDEALAEGYHNWDAWCRGGQLVISLDKTRTAAVYGVDGRTYHNGTTPAGETLLSLPEGVYVVAVNGFTRTVLVK